jgi:hypothetical protein
VLSSGDVHCRPSLVHIFIDSLADNIPFVAPLAAYLSFYVGEHAMRYEHLQKEEHLLIQILRSSRTQELPSHVVQHFIEQFDLRV